MPIYEYACKKCGNFEIMQRITEDPLKKCPTCGAKVTKLISQSAFHLKGNGWYMTDYAKNNTNPPDDNKTEEKKSSGSDTKAGLDTKAGSDTKESKSTSESSSSSPSSPSKENAAA